MDIRDRTNNFFRQSSENGLELLEGQAEMADEVSRAIEDHVPLAVEAEVDTGKSYAYLIPDVYDNQGRRWKIMSDASILCTTKNGEPASKLHSVELVTSILEYEDMALLQEVVRSIRRSGGVCNESTGIHIHIDFGPYDPQKLRNFVNIFASKEDMLYQALQVNSDRENTYCKKVDKRFLQELNKKKPRDLQTIKHL